MKYDSDNKKYSLIYKTKMGKFFLGNSENLLDSEVFKKYNGKIQLIFTSPPFPLNRKKNYGNFQAENYIKWFTNFAKIFSKLLTTDGSIVIEIGNSWETKRPVMSLLNLRSLLSFLDNGDFNLCQQFICHNPARLPSPIQWVNIERIRVKDSFTYVWWMSPSNFPKANNRQILKPYSQSMQKLLSSKKYNSGKRPSEHNIGKTSFLKDNNGAIPSNVITLTNTRANDLYQNYCRLNDLPIHPARMQPELPEFFIKFLTEPNDIVLDPFAGSNTTGAIAEQLGRKWISIEAQEKYIVGSKGRFPNTKFLLE